MSVASLRGTRRTAGRILSLVWRMVLVLAVLLAGLIALYRFAPPVSTLMIGRWITFQSVARDWMPLERISRHLRAAVIMSEDGQFCRHNGVDWGELLAVIEQAGEDGPARGASTITMQVVKNLFLLPARSTLRKGLEIPIAVAVDLAWPKRRILEVYLNVAEWGDGIFGAEAAARHHFSKSAADLTPREAALLAVALPNPLARRAGRPTRWMNARAGTIQARMAGAGEWIDCLRP